MKPPTQSNATVLQQVREVVKHGALVLAADSAEVAQEATAIGHHLWESDFLHRENKKFSFTSLSIAD